MQIYLATCSGASKTDVCYQKLNQKKNVSRQILKIEWRITNIYVFDLDFNQIHIFKCIIVFYVPVIAVYGDMMELFTFMIWLNCLYLIHCLSLKKKLVLLWAQLTKIYPPLPTSVQPISITKTLLIVPTKNETDPPLFISSQSETAKVKIVKNERDPPLFTGTLVIKFQNILRNTTQVIIRHRITILFPVISSPITLERQKWKSSKMTGILLSSPVSCW